MAAPRNGTHTIAAVDLGSNSFHMVVARAEQGQLRVVDRLRERVALGAGLDDEGRLSDEMQERALACLRRFGQRLRELPRENVRVIGTNALRVAKNARGFLSRAERALGHPVEVVPGREEARLIHLGVAHSEPEAPGRRLVVDIGGGSTEVIVGERFEPLRTDSLYMGCVSWTRRFFRDGRITPKAMRQARIAARLEVQTIARLVQALGWDEALGASGTILAIDGVLRANGHGADGITTESLDWLADVAQRQGRIARLDIAGLEPERAEVLPGGLTILQAVLEGLHVDRMRATPGALREGVLYDLIGRIRHEDVRDRTIRSFAKRHRVDEEQAARVERTAKGLLDAAARPWKLQGDAPSHLISWASRLHEVGLSVAYAGHHKHGDYLLRNSDMPGFSKPDQDVLATVVRFHRRKIEREEFAALAADAGSMALRVCLLLRLSVRLHHSRSARRLPDVKLVLHGDSMSLRFPKGWLDRHPLTRADLGDEARELAAAGIDLVVG
ncbi:MAG: exopolyphosphatase [Planctomycetes bacterium]|nr:exopolyphosphatase [Planctomycetota bacterium]